MQRCTVLLAGAITAVQATGQEILRGPSTPPKNATFPNHLYAGHLRARRSTPDEWRVVLNFPDTPPYFVESQRKAILLAASVWESFISRGPANTPSCTVSVRLYDGGLENNNRINLAQAGRNAADDPASGTISFNKHVFQRGACSFCYNDALLYDIALHEIGHVIGIMYGGRYTLSDYAKVVNGVLVFAGPKASDAYCRDVRPRPSPCNGIPLETEGGGGSAKHHWHQYKDEFRTFSGTTHFDHAIMTATYAWPSELSAMSIFALSDLGYTTSVCIDASDCPHNTTCIPHDIERVPKTCSRTNRADANAACNKYKVPK